MAIASITTDIYIGPFIIPSNGQNMIMNNYAVRNNLRIDLVIPEPMMSDKLLTTQWLKDKQNLSKIILCSIHQLPKIENDVNILISTMKKIEFHFALEGINGIGKDFINKCILESQIFTNAEYINSEQNDWITLHNMMLTNRSNNIK